MDQSIPILDMTKSELIEWLKLQYRSLDWSMRDTRSTMFRDINIYLKMSNDMWKREFKLKNVGQWEKLPPHKNILELKQSITPMVDLPALHDELFDSDSRTTYRIDDHQLHVLENEVCNIIQKEVEREDIKTTSDLCHHLCVEIFTPFAQILQSQGLPEAGTVTATVAPNGKSLEVTCYWQSIPGSVSNYITVIPLDMAGRGYKFVMPCNTHFKSIPKLQLKLKDLMLRNSRGTMITVKSSNDFVTNLTTIVIRGSSADGAPIPPSTIRLMFLNINLVGYGAESV